MKISKYLGTFALLAMLAACSTEDEQVRFAGDEVKVNATIGGESVFTRSNPIGSTEEQSVFQDFDQIGISVNGGAAHKYEMKNGVWGVAESEVPIKWESEATDFKAFYPYSYNNINRLFSILHYYFIRKQIRHLTNKDAGSVLLLLFNLSSCQMQYF